MIGGQNEAYIVSALNAYKKGERKHPTMRGIADSLSEQDMADVAAFYAGHGKAKDGKAISFEARVKALGGKLADCYPDMHHPRAASAMGRTVYAVGLTCITRDHSAPYDEDNLGGGAYQLVWEEWN